MTQCLWFMPGFLRAHTASATQVKHPVKQLSLPNWRRLFSRADRFSAPDAWTALANELGFSHFPFAQILACTGGYDPQQAYALITPSAVKTDHRGVYWLGDRALQLNNEEQNLVFHALAEWLKGDGLSLYQTGSEHWLLKLAERQDYVSVPFLQAIGRDAMAILPIGSDALYWQAKQTEWQMLLSQHYINQTRATQHKALLQNAYLWGFSSGQLPHTSTLDAVYTDSSAVAIWLQRTSTALPVLKLDEMKKNVSDFKRVAVIVTQAEAAWSYGDFSAWQQILENSDDLLLKDCSHRVFPDDGFFYSYETTHRWRFWRSARYLPESFL